VIIVGLGVLPHRKDNQVRVGVAVIVLLMITATVNRLPGCGDKFLVSSRGTRYQHAPLTNGSAAILIYANPSSPIVAAIDRVSAVSTLRRAGYRPMLVQTPAEFEDSLQRGGWDLVLVGLSDADAVSRRVKSTAGVLPVVLTSEDLTAVRKRYPLALKDPTNRATLLNTIADALSSRPREKAKGR